jgi:hypothetical protein
MYDRLDKSHTRQLALRQEDASRGIDHQQFTIVLGAGRL